MGYELPAQLLGNCTTGVIITCNEVPSVRYMGYVAEAQRTTVSEHELRESN